MLALFALFVGDIHEAREWIASLREADAADLASVLPAWDSFAAKEAAVARAGVVLSAPAVTVILGWERALVSLTYDPKQGFRAAPRAGAAALLLALADVDAEVVVWSARATSDTARADLHALVSEFVAPADAARYAAFQSFLNTNYERAAAFEVAQARREARATRPMFPIAADDRTELYAQTVLRIAAVLGKEHCFGGGGAIVRPAAVLATTRAQSDVVVIDCEDAAEWGMGVGVVGGQHDANGGVAASGDVNFLHISPLDEGGDGGGVGGGGGRPLGGADTDATLFLVAELINCFSAWRKGRGVGDGASFAEFLNSYGGCSGRLTAESTRRVLRKVHVGVRARVTKDAMGVDAEMNKS